MEDMKKYLDLIDKQQQEREQDLQDLVGATNENAANSGEYEYNGSIVPAGELLTAVADCQRNVISQMPGADERGNIILHAQWTAFQIMYNTITGLAEEREGAEQCGR